MLNEINEKITKLALDSTAHGLPNVLKSKRLFNKLFWFCFLLTSSVVSFYYVSRNILAYLDYEVVSIVKTEYVQPAEFPTITFCSQTAGTFNDLNKFKFEEISFGYEDPKSLSNDLESFFSTLKGRCFRFNSGKNMSNHSIPSKYSSIGGRDDGFYLKLNTSFTILAWIHNRSEPPIIESFNNHDNPVIITNGTKSNIAITKLVISKLGYPYNECLNDFSLFKGNMTIINHILAKNQSYTQKVCLTLCFQVNYIAKNPCDCNETTLGNVWFDCFSKKEKKNRTGCTYKFKNDFYKKNLIQECKQYCPHECESVTYSFTVNNYNNYDRRTTAAFYYQTLQYTLITQQPKLHLFDLISGIGGTLGLFIGISFVNLFEIGEILTEIFLILFSRLKKPEQSGNATSSLKNVDYTEIHFKSKLTFKINK